MGLYGQNKKQQKNGGAVMNTMLSVSSLKDGIGASYQRSIGRDRVENIKKSIKKNGFWPWSPVIIGVNGKIIDGQHRVVAASELGIDKIPVCISGSENEIQEAQLFNDVNSFNTRLKPLEKFNAMHLSLDPIALLVYRLNNDEASLLKDKIQVKGSDNNRTRISIPAICNIIMRCAFGSATDHKGDKENLFRERIKNAEYVDIRGSVNVFMQWFYSLYGDDKPSNPIPYSERSIDAISNFYLKLERTGLFKEKNGHKTALAKMASFKFSTDWGNVSRAGRVNLLISHWNRNRKTNLIDYV
jgi:hypothetical protein